MTTRSNEKTPIRVIAIATTAVGAALLLRPRQVSGWVSPSGRTPDDLIVRVLGGRQVLQGTVQIGRPNGATLTAGAVVDALHAISMLVLAAIWPAYRRPALASAAVAGTFAAAAAAVRKTAS